MALRGQAKVDYQREYMRQRRAALRVQSGTVTLSKAEVRAMRRSGISPEEVRDAGSLAAAQGRTIDALRARVAWYQENLTPPVTAAERARGDLATIRRLGSEIAEQQHQITLLRRHVDLLQRRSPQPATRDLAARVTLLEAERTLDQALSGVS